MTERFTRDFDSYVCEGDRISCTVGDTIYTARLVRDTDTRPDDFDIVDEFSLEAWKQDLWHYFGVVIDAERDGWQKTNLASLWAIEGNYPSRSRTADENPNLYFRTVANELLDEILLNDTH